MGGQELAGGLVARGLGLDGLPVDVLRGRPHVVLVAGAVGREGVRRVRVRKLGEGRGALVQRSAAEDEDGEQEDEETLFED